MGEIQSRAVSIDCVAIGLVCALVLSCSPKRSKDVPGTLHLAMTAKIAGLDPARVDDDYSQEQVAYTYDGLLQYHYLKRPYTLMPNLAEEMPEVSKDHRSYVFRLKKGVFFQDDPCFKETRGKGRELTAEDFVYSLKRVASPEIQSPAWASFEGKVKGLDEWREEARRSGPAAYSAPIEGLQAIDRYTLRITLVKPSPLFLYLLAATGAFVVPREAVESYGQEFMRHPVGTGPFRLIREELSENRLVWTRNPTYRKDLYPEEGEPGDREAGLLADAGRPLPLADRIVVEIFEETQPMWLSFLAGKLDISFVPTDMIAAAVGPAEEASPELKAKGIRIFHLPGVGVKFIGLNMSDPLLGKNKLLRQALSEAVDAKAFIDIFFSGHGIPAQGPIPPELIGYDSDYRSPNRRFDLSRAKSLLARAGFPDGRGLPVFQFATRPGTFGRQLADFMAREFAAIGVRITVDTYAFPMLMTKLAKRQIQMWYMGDGPSLPDADSLFKLFYGKNVSPGPNVSNYSNPEFDRLFEQSLTPMADAARELLYRRMTALLAEDCPWIFLVYPTDYNGVGRGIRNIKPGKFMFRPVKYIGVLE